ncbi:uncharacterized protein LOC105635592 isoform X2 [Jatropha curcas]|uniref:uncharacterized protein LOC105635592 isoform X2 n=1 Tax=Jatropha curcas TaxID=180498 RepID=UPI0005FC2742|nr:uncharacterized protein LOC105635592 isoform X2 [Jatropha curcas]XP_020535563.1 uncharacterized protein LOC105635592 isoform X2 [Jatropha curcas]
MMVANRFDLWQKDAFFSAAEEVQESADVMQSAYRMWLREKKEESEMGDLDELSRELQTALGTAKWQLEEFEKAVRLSHGHCVDDITASRHKQFVAAIESQISHVEAALREAFNEEGKPPLQWVNLNQEERDDLALFLSGTIQTPEITKDDCFTVRPPVRSPFTDHHYMRKDADHNLNATSSGGTYDEKDVNDVTTDKNGEFIIDVDEKGSSRMRDDIICQADRTAGTRKTWSSPNFGALKIVVADRDEHTDGSMPSIEATPKEKGLKRLFWKQRCGEYSRARGPFNLINQVGGFQRQMQAPAHLQFSCSVQLTLALMLSIFLIVPFLIYSA